jgi:hypothetical protein
MSGSFDELGLTALQSVAIYSTYLDKLSSIFMDIGRSAPRYQTMALLYPQSKRLQASLAEYFVVVVSFCHQIWKFTQKSAITKIVSALSDLGLDTHQRNLESWAAVIREEVNSLTAEKAHDNGHEITSIKALVSKGHGFVSHQRNLQIKFRALDLCSTYEFQTAWKQTRKIGHSSLFSHCSDYQDWRRVASSSTLIYIGKLGAGKSVLLANIVNDLSTWIPKAATPVTYFFCRHDDQKSLEARTILGSLARQLLVSVPDLALVKNLPDEGTSHLDIEDICKLLQRVFPVDRPAYFVLDGLDECDSTTKELLVQQLQKLQKTIILHLCISVRLDPANSQTLNLNSLTAIKTVLMPDKNPDIEAYIDAELENLISTEKLRLGNPIIVLDIQ